VKTIGRGGMAEVYLARRRGAAGIAKRLVVKRMRQDLNSDPRFADMFLREARVATQLSHKNIVTVFDVGRDPDGLFLAMEYVDGPDLAAAMQGARERGVALDPLLAAHIASEVAAGLDHAHRLRDEGGAALGLVHRDITPRNILLSLDGEVKVTDFGVAVLQGDSPDGRRGTVPYMSPEQARGDALDPRADLFSLGLILYELLSGRRAYAGADRDEMLAQARAAEIPPLAPEVPAELAHVVARATAPAAADRFHCARDMQRELAGWAVGERGRRGQTDPLEHALASFLASAVPGWSARAGESADGAAGVAGTATLQSVAETRADEPPSAKREPTERVVHPRRPLALVVGGALALVAAAILFATTRGPSAVDDAAQANSQASAKPPAVRGPEPVYETSTVDRAVESTAPPVSPASSAGATPRMGESASGEVRASAPVSPAPTAGRRAESATSPLRRASRGVVPRVTGRTGILELNAVPWAYVSIDGQPEEETPIRARVLSAGRHRVKIRNPILEQQREIAVEISPGETTRHVVDLRQ
jgi:eukaryotic-like serine/threonine-protein kinase